MSSIKIISIICVQILSVIVIAFVGSSLGFVLSLAGFVAIEDIGYWSSGIPYLYFPLSGLLFVCGVSCLIAEGKARNNQLAFTGEELGFKILRFWRIQNILMAAISLSAYALLVTYSIGYFRGQFEHLQK
ncbi:MAG: hypothetical protein R3C09_25170 [Pirellulaceae bacterium]